jgi:hypothetical protein
MELDFSVIGIALRDMLAQAAARTPYVLVAIAVFAVFAVFCFLGRFVRERERLAEPPGGGRVDASRTGRPAPADTSRPG